MGKPYSMDLRKRVVAAIETGGLSCHQAAAQFGVGVSTAIVWVRRLRETGSVAPGQIGGHKPKAISGEHRAWLLERTKARDFTLRGLVAELAERGLKVDYRAVWNFVHAEKLSFKKNRGGQRTRSPRRRAPAGAVGQKYKPHRASAAGLPLHDPDPGPHNGAATMGTAAPAAPHQRSAPGLG